MSTQSELPELSFSRCNSQTQIEEEECTTPRTDENRVPSSAFEFISIKRSELPESSSQRVCNSPVKIHGSVKREENSDCRTPKSDENKIPVSVNCPRAPVKPKNRVILSKRKLSDASIFFENQDRGCDQLESFFESMETDKSRSRIRKRLLRL